MSEIRDEFLSEEDLDLRNMTWEEVMAYSVLWLEQAQATNDLDAHLYSHGVFEREPPWNEHPSKPGEQSAHAGRL
jgi:hypothetical protein